MSRKSKRKREKALAKDIQASLVPPKRAEIIRSQESYGHAVVTGSTPGYWNSNHYRETENFRGWTYVAVHTAAKLYASATPTVYDKPPADGRLKGFTPDAPTKKETPCPDHHIARLMDRPNPVFSGQVFRYQIGQQIRLTGGCLIWEVRNAFGVPVELWVLPRAWCQFQPVTAQFPEGGYRVQPVSNSVTMSYFQLPSMAGFFLDARLVIRVGWPSPLYPGEFTSPLSACSMQIDIADELDTATYAGFQNAPKPTLHIDVDPGIDPESGAFDRIRAEVQSRTAGSWNAGRPLITQGSKVSPLISSPAELDYINGRNQSRDTTFGIQQVTPIVAGITETTAYAAAAASAKQTVEFSIQPDLDLIGGALTHRWRPIYGDAFRVAFDAKNYDDPTVNLQYIQAKIASGKYTDNEIRAEFGDAPIEGGDVTPAQKEQQAKEQQQQQAQQMAAVRGQPGEPLDGEEDEDDLLDDDGDEGVLGIDAPDISTPTLTGLKRPDLSKASGNKLVGPKRLKAADWKEQDHPRAADGKFGSGSGGKEDGSASGGEKGKAHAAASHVAALSDLHADAIGAEIAELRRSQRDMIKRILAPSGRLRKAEREARGKEIVALNKQVKEADARLNDLLAAQQKHKEEVRAKAFGLLEAADPSAVRAASVAQSLGDTAAAQVAAVLDSVGKILHGGHALEIDVKDAGGRAYAQRKGDGGRPVVAVAADGDAGTTAHELGHVIEWTVPGVREAVAEFAARRFGDEPLVSLKDAVPGFGYGKKETGRKDSFDRHFPTDAAYYIGKSYGSGSTEIVSMGLQALWDDAAAFAKNDPDYCAFIVSVLRGKPDASEHK